MEYRLQVWPYWQREEPHKPKEQKYDEVCGVVVRRERESYDDGKYQSAHVVQSAHVGWIFYNDGTATPVKRRRRDTRIPRAYPLVIEVGQGTVTREMWHSFDSRLLPSHIDGIRLVNGAFELMLVQPPHCAAQCQCPNGRPVALAAKAESAARHAKEARARAADAAAQASDAAAKTKTAAEEADAAEAEAKAAEIAARAAAPRAQ
jgi:hypothetical protein